MLFYISRSLGHQRRTTFKSLRKRVDQMTVEMMAGE